MTVPPTAALPRTTPYHLLMSMIEASAAAGEIAGRVLAGSQIPPRMSDEALLRIVTRAVEAGMAEGIKRGREEAKAEGAR
jgi:hypothetical protein